MKVDAVRARFARTVATPAPAPVAVAGLASSTVDETFERVRALIVAEGRVDFNALARVKRAIAAIERDPLAAALPSGGAAGATFPTLDDLDRVAGRRGGAPIPLANPYEEPSPMTLVGKSRRARDVYTFPGALAEMTCPKCGSGTLSIGRTDEFGEVFTECRDCGHEFGVHECAPAPSKPVFTEVAPAVKTAADYDPDDGHVNSILARQIRDANPGLFHDGRHPATLRSETKSTVAVFVDVSLGAESTRFGRPTTAPNKATAAHVVEVFPRCIKKIDFVPAVTGGALVTYRIEIVFEKARPGDREAFEAFGKKFDVHVAGAKR